MTDKEEKPSGGSPDAVTRREFLRSTYSTALVGLLLGAGAASQAACNLPYADYANYYYDYAGYYNYGYTYYNTYYDTVYYDFSA